MKDNLALFNSNGLSNIEAVALIGAHTIGGINNCTGFKGINKGAFC